MRIKRGIDIIVSALGLIVAAPVMGVVALGILRRMGRPILFRQERPGLHERPFDVLKFRTMTAEVAADGTPLPDDQRITAFGSTIRQLSLDELPQLVNILRGDMSLIGPRPLLMEYLPRYSPEQRRRHLMRPGLTGLAQVNGRNALDWDRRFDLDTRYVDSWSLLLDLHILAKTIGKVLRREGISGQGTQTMTPFLGTTEQQS
jgi:lipopolysaccharide/colanic/teichoic acid biosynthesis glycosyltransferase